MKIIKKRLPGATHQGGERGNAETESFLGEVVFVQPVRVVCLLKSDDSPAFGTPFSQQFRRKRAVLFDFQVRAGFASDFRIYAGVPAADNPANATAASGSDDAREIYVAVHWRDGNDQLTWMGERKRLTVADLFVRGIVRHVIFYFFATLLLNWKPAVRDRYRSAPK